MQQDLFMFFIRFFFFVDNFIRFGWIITAWWWNKFSGGNIGCDVRSHSLIYPLWFMTAAAATTDNGIWLNSLAFSLSLFCSCRIRHLIMPVNLCSFCFVYFAIQWFISPSGWSVVIAFISRNLVKKSFFGFMLIPGKEKKKNSTEMKIDNVCRQNV